MRGVTGLCRRVYHDYLRPDQTTGYEALLRMAVENGYVFETVSSFDQRIREGGVQPQSRYCILRRDVDTKALSTLRRMLQAEVKYGARCSYFSAILRLISHWSSRSLPQAERYRIIMRRWQLTRSPIVSGTRRSCAPQCRKYGKCLGRI